MRRWTRTWRSIRRTAAWENSLCALMGASGPTCLWESFVSGSVRSQVSWWDSCRYVEDQRSTMKVYILHSRPWKMSVFPSKIGTWWEQNSQTVGLVGHAGVRRHSNQGNPLNGGSYRAFTWGESDIKCYWEEKEEWIDGQQFLKISKTLWEFGCRERKIGKSFMELWG